MALVRDGAVIGFVAAILAGGLMAAQAREARPAPADVATAEAATSLPSEQTDQAQVTAERIVSAPCGRKVRVVYSGYGSPAEGCATPSR